jgi:hypothetical protein
MAQVQIRELGHVPKMFENAIDVTHDGSSVCASPIRFARRFKAT